MFGFDINAGGTLALSGSPRRELLDWLDWFFPLTNEAILDRMPVKVRFRSGKINWMVLGVVSALCLSSVLPAQGRQSSASATNAPPRALKKDALKLMEEDLFRPMKGLAPESSIETMTSPQLRAPVNNRNPEQSHKLKDQKDREKNWMLLSPNDLIPGITPSEWLKLREYDSTGVDQKKLSVVEKFYLNAETEKLKNARKGSAADSLSPEQDRRGNDNSADESSLPAGLAERTHSLKGLFRDPDGNNNSGRDEIRDDQHRGPSLSDIFGIGPAKSDRLDHVDFHKNRMDDYRESLGLAPLPVSPLEANNPFAAMRAPPKSAPAPRIGLPEGAHAIDFNAGGGSFGTINPLAGRSAFQDTTLRGYGSSSLAPALPRTEPSKVPPPAAFNITKRPF